jgi:exopolysaccharide production protein ExoZ
MSVSELMDGSKTKFTPGHGHARHELTQLPRRNLDVLRASAIGLFLVGQIMRTAGVFTNTPRWFVQASLCAFMVHTGLVLMSSLERDGAPTRPGWRGRFYLKRAVRVYPLVWVAIAIVCVLNIPPVVFARFEPVSPVVLVTNLLLVQDLALKPSIVPASWSLAVAVQMYLFFPLLYVLARKRTWVPLLAALAVSVVLVMVASYGLSVSHVLPLAKRVTVAQYALPFVLGVVSYRMLRSGTRRVLLPASTWPYVIVFGLGVGGLCFDLTETWIARAVFSAILAVPLALAADMPESLASRVAAVAAEYAYAAFLSSLIALQVGFDTFSLQSPPVKVLIATGVLVVLSVALHHLVEKPCMKLARGMLGERMAAS